MPDRGFGLYLHWPFCQAKCPYCDFNSHVWSNIDQDEWCSAYLSELDRVASQTSDRIVKSVFFGGGTPSLMQASTVCKILDRIYRNWRLSNDVEITLEANPTSVEAERFAGYRDAGVNRVSLGVQALNDADLKRLGRLHSVQEALTALDCARSSFDRVSFDLIYARQDQTEVMWVDELTRALSFDPSHLSLYQLTIEPNTAFGARFEKGKLPGLPEEDRAADLWDITQELCERADLPAYEISNHAKPGEESRHNLIYWQSGDYVGIGPGAQGRLTFGAERYATETVLSPSEWISSVKKGLNKHESRTILSDIEREDEYFLMGLRVRSGVELPNDLKKIIISNIKYLEDLSLVKLEENVLKLTETGRPLLNGVLRKLLDRE